MNDQNDYADRYLHCREKIAALGGVAWRRLVRRPCPPLRTIRLVAQRQSRTVPERRETLVRVDQW